MFEAHTGVRSWFLISNLISHPGRFVISFGLFTCQSEQHRASCPPFELEPAWERREWIDMNWYELIWIDMNWYEILNVARDLRFERQHSATLLHCYTLQELNQRFQSCTSELNRSYPPWGDPSLLRGMREQSEKRSGEAKKRSVFESF